MPINVGGKLWLAFFCTLTLTVLTMYLLLHGSLQRGFLDYTSQQAVQRLDILKDALVNIHRTESSFAKLQQDPHRWLQLKSIIFPENVKTDPDARTNIEQYNSSQNYYNEFVNSISLFDTNKNLLMGIIKPSKTISWLPLDDSGATLGFVGFVKPDVVVRESDRNFMTHQLRFFGTISIVVLFISIAVATLLTRRISRPIKALSQHVEALASGDYQQRLEVKSRDEIGQLVENFNKLAQTLEANENSRANWIADISHEMRTPVAVIQAQIEAMQDGVRALDSNGLGLLHRKVAGLNNLVDDLFELTLSDIGALNYQKHELTISDLVNTCVEQYQAKAAESGLALQAIIPANRPIQMHGDSKRLEQLLDNLLENAIRYTHSGGKIEIELSETADKIILLVRDSAPTVALEQREKIFERLHRLENSRNRTTGGAGLGLAICSNIVAAHQGTINAEDSALGGLTIRVEFPKNNSVVAK